MPQVKPEDMQWLLRSFDGSIVRMATHPYGCRVVQRMVEHLHGEHLDRVVDELLAHAPDLVHSAYGNYTLQALAERGSREHRSALVRVVQGNVVVFSQHKFASNVVERVLEFATPAEKAALVDEILQPTLAAVAAHPQRALPEDNGTGAALTPLQLLLRHEFGNFVCQRAIAESTDAQRARLLALIREYAPALRRYPYGKHILARLDKLASRSLLTLPMVAGSARIGAGAAPAAAAGALAARGVGSCGPSDASAVHAASALAPSPPPAASPSVSLAVASPSPSPAPAPSAAGHALDAADPTADAAEQ
jgi:pumilio RNA-binding family